MKRMERLAIAAAALGVAAAAIAAETITYRYDARGDVLPLDTREW